MYCVFSMGHCALPEIKLSYLILYYMELDIRMFTVVLTLTVIDVLILVTVTVVLTINNTCVLMVTYLS